MNRSIGGGLFIALITLTVAALGMPSAQASSGHHKSTGKPPTSSLAGSLCDAPGPLTAVVFSQKEFEEAREFTFHRHFCLQGNGEFSITDGWPRNLSVEVMNTAWLHTTIATKITARDKTKVNAKDSTIHAFGSSSVVSRGSSEVYARHDATVTSYDRSTIHAQDATEIITYDSSTATAMGNARVIAHDSSRVEASDNSVVTADGESNVKLYGYAELFIMGEKVRWHELGKNVASCEYMPDYVAVDAA